jgi:dihydrofolate synthase/folylpolyglutamate synthase
LSYETTLAWLYGLESRLGMDFRLARLGPVLDLLDHPERAFPSVHIAGTNGKGSTAAFLHSILHAANVRVGLYTSPHLLSFRERIRVDAARIGEAAVVAHSARVREAMAEAGVELTFFEIATLMAFLEFRERDVELAVVETGLGGRLDATNIIDSVIAVITSIGHDHEEFLGDSLESIAMEKAGILREDIPLVTGAIEDRALEVIGEARSSHGSAWLKYGRDFGPWTGAQPLAGEHQRVNAAVAVAAARLLAGRFAIGEDALNRGVAEVRWPARFERVATSPEIIVDGAHNPQAANTIASELERTGRPQPPGRNVLLFGAMADKDWGEMLSVLAPGFDEIVLTPVRVARSFDAAGAAEAIGTILPCRTADNATEALGVARSLAGPSGRVVVTGSIFLAAEIYQACGGDVDPFGQQTS